MTLTGLLFKAGAKIEISLKKSMAFIQNFLPVLNKSHYVTEDLISQIETNRLILQVFPVQRRLFL
jgi:hypothetical protein